MEELTVTITLDEYRDLIDANARYSILRSEMISDLHKEIEKQKEVKKDVADLYSITRATVEWEKISNIMGFLPTFEGFREKENELKKAKENTVNGWQD